MVRTAVVLRDRLRRADEALGDLVEAARRAGLGRQEHHNGHAYRGAWLCEIAHAAGRRFSAYDAYLDRLEDIVLAAGRTAGVMANFVATSRYGFDHGFAPLACTTCHANSTPSASGPSEAR